MDGKRRLSPGAERRCKLRRFISCVVLSGALLPAHHSFTAEFDSKRPVHLEGVVARFDFVNPHAEIYLDVGGERWWVEAASPSALVRRGIGRSSLRVGMSVTIDGYQAKDASRRVYGREVTFGDGRVFALNPADR